MISLRLNFAQQKSKLTDACWFFKFLQCIEDGNILNSISEWNAVLKLLLSSVVNGTDIKQVKTIQIWENINEKHLYN